MSWAGWLIVSGVMMIGAVVQGAIGFGLNLLAAPIVVLVDADLVPAPLIIAAALMTLLVAVRERQHLDLRGLGWAVIGRVPGSVLGAIAVAKLPTTPLRVLFAGTVLLGVGLTLVGGRVRPTPRTALGAGFLSGVMGTASSVGGPPVALVYQDAPGAQMRATLSAFFLFGTLVSLALLVPAGRLGWAEWRAGVTLLPAVMLGFALSGRARHVIDRGYTRNAVLIVSTLGAIGVLARELAR